jgi:hypothetical protein
MQKHLVGARGSFGLKALTFIAMISVNALFAAPQTQAFELAVVGALNFPSVSVDQATTPQILSGTAGVGAGVLMGVGLVPELLDLEIGALYMPRKINFSGAAGAGAAAVSTSGGSSFKYLEVPVMVRFVALPLVSVGAGAYYAQALGDVSLNLNNANGTTSDATDTYSGQGIKKSDFGLVGSVGLKFPILPTLDLLVDARYLLGLVNTDDTGLQTRKNRSFETLVGVAFSL